MHRQSIGCGFAPDMHAPSRCRETYAGASCATVSSTFSSLRVSYCYYLVIMAHLSVRQTVRRLNGTAVKKIPKSLTHDAMPAADLSKQTVVHGLLCKHLH